MCLRYGPASHGRKRCLAHGCSAPAGLIRVDIMNLPRRQFLHLAAGAAVLPAVSRVGWAQTYPMRPVHVTVGFPAGSTADILARLIGQWLSERLGQPFITDNDRVRIPIWPPRRSCVRPRTATRSSMLHRPTRSMRRSTTSSTTTSSATWHRSQASSARPWSWWSIHRLRPRRSQSSLPTPRLIPASSTWRRPATASCHVSQASYSR